MAYRKISLLEKVSALKLVFETANKTKIAGMVGWDPSTLIYLINEKILPNLETLLANEKPGPKTVKPDKSSSGKSNSSAQDSRPDCCTECGSTKVWKNGFYFVLNWLIIFGGTKLIDLKTKIQRYICGDCFKPIISEDRVIMVDARKKGKVILKRLITFCKFKLRQSHRSTQQLVSFVFPNLQASISYIDGVTQQIGAKSKSVLDKLKDCPQKIAHLMMGDETFPKIIAKGADYAKSIAIVICEFGVIRAVRAVSENSKNLKSIFKNTLGKVYQPLYFLSDYDKLYPGVLKAINSNIKQLKDIVHTLRLIHRYFEAAIRDITMDYPKGLPFKERKRQKKLKQKLLRKHLRPIKYLLFKAFTPGFEGVAHLYVEAALDELKKSFIQFQSVEILHRKLNKFFTKYLDVLIFQLEHREQIISTTNALESKNSIIKAFTKAAKSYQKAKTCENTLNGIALMENFDVKTRGDNEGTSAFSRANIDLGASDFFECVGLGL